jgi:hypothetical protein
MLLRPSSATTQSLRPSNLHEIARLVQDLWPDYCNPPPPILLHKCMLRIAPMIRLGFNLAHRVGEIFAFAAPAVARDLLPLDDDL